MSLAVINIDDAGVQVSVDGDLVRTSPGIAVLDNDRLLTGEDASRNAKLLPRWTNSRFWSQLNTAPIANATSQVRHHADLAFAHLENLWLPIKNEVSEVAFVVPGYYSGENLGLLLGIAKETGIPTTSIADQSVIAASNLPLRKTILHLDIHLHAITLTRITNNSMLDRQSVRVIVETGLFTLWERWANIIANQFIQSTRFDPMHDATSEQKLFDALPGWIQESGQEQLPSFRLDLGNADHSVAISNENLLKACTPLYPQIVQAIRAEIPTGETASLLVSHHFKGFPGLRQSLELINEIELVDLTELKTVGSAHVLKDALSSDNGAVSHITRIEASENTSGPEQQPEARASHLLKGSNAIAVGRGIALDADLDRCADTEATCLLYFQNSDLILEPKGSVLLNGNQIDTVASLTPGDTLQSGEATATLISVAGDGQA